MKLFGMVAAVTLLSCQLVHAEDGLVVHFKITKTHGTETSTYTNGVLMRQTEASTFTFPKLYEMRLESRNAGDGKVNLVVTLKDLAGGVPIYAGSGAATMKIGESQTLSFHELESAADQYSVFLDTSYGKLPDEAKQ